MWKIIFLFSLLARALSAPSGCIEMCNSLNSQSYQKLSCCGLPMVSPPNEDKNWTDHKDFQTTDGALVHTKDGRYVHGNTHGSFNEMSYYKEFGSGNNQHFGGNFGTNKHSGSNFGVNQKIEDLATSSQSSFESMFQSKFAGLIQNFHDSFNHLQELKKKGQLQTQECIYPCVPVNEQITQMQQQLASQQQYMQRMREDLWTRMQSQNSMVEHVEQVPVVQQPVQSTYYPGQVVKEINHHESHRNEKITTHPHVTTKVTYQPVKYVSAAQQTHGTGSTNQGYYGGSTSHQGSSRYTQGHGSGIQTQAGYGQQNSDYGSQSYGSQIVGSQTQASHGQPNSGYGSQRYGSQTVGSQSQATHGQQNSGYESQSYGSQAVGSQSQAGYGQQNLGYRSQTFGSQTDGSQGCGPQGCLPQDAVTVSHGSVSHSSMTHNYGVGFGSTDGSLTHGLIGMGPTPDCNDDSHLQSYSQSRRYKRHSLHHRHHQPEDLSQQLSDFQQVEQPSQDYSQQSSQRIEDFGEPARIQKVSQQEIEALGQQVEDIRHGKLQTQDINQKSKDFTQQTQDLTQQTQDFTQQTQDFTQQTQNLGNDYYQQSRGFDDFPQQTGKLELGHQQNRHYSQHPGQQHRSQIPSLSQQTQDFTQQNHGFDAYPQYSGKLEFGQQHQQHPSQIPSFSQQSQDFTQQNHGFDDYLQHSGKLEFGQQHQQHPSQIPSLSQQTQDFTQQHNLGFNDYSQQSGKLEFGQQHQQHLSQIPSLSQHTQDFSQQQNHGFNQHSGPLEFGQQHQQYPSQMESLSQQTQGFGTFPKPEKLERGQGVQKVGRLTEIEDLTQQSPTVSDFSQHSRGFDQQTVGNLKLDQPARASLDFNQFPTPVLAPDSNQLGNQRFQGLNQQFNLPAKPAPKPTSRPRNPKSTQLNLDQNTNAEKIFNTDHEKQTPFENLRNTGRGDISAESGDSSAEKPLTPPEVSDTQVGYQQSSEERYHEKDFGQQVQKPTGIFSQQAQKPVQDFSHEIQRQSRNFSQDVQKLFEDFSQQVQRPRESFSQQVQKSFEDFSQQVQRPRENFSQQVQKPFEDFSQQVQRPRESFSQQVQKPFEDFSQQVQKPFEDLSQQVQRPHEDFSQISDLSRNKDITQLPQEPRRGLTQSHQVQGKFADHISSDMSQQTQEISLGNQWHRSHNPGDLTNENLQLEKFPDQIQQSQQVQQTQQRQQVQQRDQASEKKEKDFIRFDQQSTQEQLGSWQQKMSREIEVIRGTAGKLEFGQSVQSQGSDSQLRSERTTELSLQPRILEAYGGRGPYDPMHSEDIFNGVRLNPSATLPPSIEGDPWDIREKPITPKVINEDRVIPLDTTWVFPDALPTIPVTEAPKPGFWGRVGHKLSGAVDKAKEKARDIFG